MTKSCNELMQTGTCTNGNWSYSSQFLHFFLPFSSFCTVHFSSDWHVLVIRHVTACKVISQVATLKMVWWKLITVDILNKFIHISLNKVGYITLIKLYYVYIYKQLHRIRLNWNEKWSHSLAYYNFFFVTMPLQTILIFIYILQRHSKENS